MKYQHILEVVTKVINNSGFKKLNTSGYHGALVVENRVCVFFNIYVLIVSEESGLKLLDRVNRSINKELNEDEFYYYFEKAVEYISTQIKQDEIIRLIENENESKIGIRNYKMNKLYYEG